MDQSEPTRLLLVDDEAALREPLAEYLSRQGFAVDQAASAAENASITAKPSQRRYQGTCVRTDTFGAAMPNRWRNFQ